MKIDRGAFALFIYAKRRLGVGLTHQAVAEAAGVTVSSVRLAERRRIIPTRDFERLAAWHGTPAAAFVKEATHERRGRQRQARAGDPADRPGAL